MSCVENTVVGSVTREGIREDGVPAADDIIQITTASSAVVVSTPEQDSSHKRRYKLFLRILQKINMVFLVLFLCYFAWTISANYGYNSDVRHTTHNDSSRHNATIQHEDYYDFSGTKNIPFTASADDNNTDPPYHTNIVLPAHRKQTKKRRKKGRNKKRNRRLKNKLTQSQLEEYLNLTTEPHKNTKNCKDCKIRKRKGRNRFESAGLSPTTLRKILERVADDTLSGARSGGGTISSLNEGDAVGRPTKHPIDKDREENGWSFGQPWTNVAEDDTVHQKYPTGTDGVDNAMLTTWTSWSPCSTTCGAGQKERMRECGAACKEVESMVCISPPCEGGEGESASAITEFYKWEGDGFVPPLQVPEEEFLDPNEDVCRKWVRCNKEFAHEFIKNSSLPSCPCVFPLQRVRSKQIWDRDLKREVLWVDASSHSDLVYKPEASVCMRSQLFPGTLTLAVQQCCYDNAHLLVTRGKAAGTPNLISKDISKELHYKVDLLPWIICKGDWTRYNEVLPPDNGLECPVNPDDLDIMRQKAEVKIF